MFTSAAAEHRNMKLVRGRHTREVKTNSQASPTCKHDDRVDALSGARNTIDTRTHTYRISVPQGRIDLPTPGLKN